MEAGNLIRQPRGGVAFLPDMERGRLQVWERPLVNCRYLLSIRPGGAAKLVGGARDRERSVLMVLRRGYLEANSGRWIPTRLAARLRPPAQLDPTPLAEVASVVAEWYGHAIAFVEVKDSPTCAKECQRAGVSVQVREVMDETTEKWTRELGWLTDDETGPAALNALVNAIRQTGERAGASDEQRIEGDREGRWPLALQIECEHALREIETFAPCGGEAPVMGHDDDVRALAVGLYNIETASLLPPHVRERMAPRDGWKVVENFS